MKKQKLNKHSHKLEQHMKEARERVKVIHTVECVAHLLDRRDYFHGNADVAWSHGDIIEHRINCMAANKCILLWQEQKQKDKRDIK